MRLIIYHTILSHGSLKMIQLLAAFTLTPVLCLIGLVKCFSNWWYTFQFLYESQNPPAKPHSHKLIRILCFGVKRYVMCDSQVKMKFQCLHDQRIKWFCCLQDGQQTNNISAGAGLGLYVVQIHVTTDGLLLSQPKPTGSQMWRFWGTLILSSKVFSVFMFVKRR